MIIHKKIPAHMTKIIRSILTEYVEFKDGELEELLTEPKPAFEKIYWTYQQAADHLCVSKRHLINLIQKYEIEVHMAGTRTPRLDIAMIITLTGRKNRKSKIPAATNGQSNVRAGETVLQEEIITIESGNNTGAYLDKRKAELGKATVVLMPGEKSLAAFKERHLKPRIDQLFVFLGEDKKSDVLIWIN